MKTDIFSQNSKIGILGAGQLGKMLAQSVLPWDVPLHFLDKDPVMAAGLIAGNFVRGDFSRYEDVMAFGDSVDILGIEIEHVNERALIDLQKAGKTVFPNPQALKIIKDKGLQKEFYRDSGFPSSDFILVDDKIEILHAVKAGDVETPFVQKTRTGGYDGQGVKLINSDKDVDKCMDTPSVIEKKVVIDKEISVIACRDNTGNVECFPAVEMEFDPEANLVKFLSCPADISTELGQKLKQMSVDLIRAYDLRGLLAIEYFLDRSGDIYVNEVAPRPHNSGHHTIESMNVSQFEQHMRSMMGLPLLRPAIKSPAVMINLLGAEGYRGPVSYQNIERALQLSGVQVHLYGKRDTRPFRKMGHVTIVRNTLEEAREIAEDLLDNIIVKTQV